MSKETRWPQPAPRILEHRVFNVRSREGHQVISRPQRTDHVRFLFASAKEYEDFILEEAQRIGSEREDPANTVEAAD